MLRIRIAILLLLCSCVTFAQEITLECPTSPVAVNCLSRISFHGVTPQELGKATVMVTPGDGVTFEVVESKTTGELALLFQASKPNRYTISIGFNVEHVQWRKSLGDSVREATAVGLDSAFLTKLKQLSAESAIKYPHRGGSCVVHVVGSHPVPDDPDPDEPDEPTPTDFENAIKQLTRETIRSGGTPMTALALSDVFANTATSVEDGLTSIANGNAATVVGQGTRKVTATRADGKHWVEFLQALADALDTLRQDGSLSTKEAIVATFREIANGMSRAVNE